MTGEHLTDNKELRHLMWEALMKRRVLCARDRTKVTVEFGSETEAEWMQNMIRGIKRSE